MGDGVLLETSRSMTFSRSLEVFSVGIDLECGSGNTYQSLNLLTHSVRSPLVSNLGYTIALTSILGRPWLTRARRCSGKLPKVLSSP